jgi:hypothetical protein
MIRLVSVATVISTYQKPAGTVDPNDSAQTDLWASRLNVPRERLLEAISEVGTSLAAVRHRLGK